MAFTKRLVSVEELRAYIKEMGAPTLREIKEHFEIDSRSARRSLGRALYREDINLVVMGGLPVGTTFWFEWPANKAGKPNPRALREEAAEKRKAVEAKRERIKRKLEKKRDESVEVDFEREE